MNKFGIGQPVPRVEDPRFITGRGRYVDDIDLPQQCYGVVVMSPHAHARIKKVDTAKAKAAEGVLAVLTGADVTADKLGGLVPNMPEDMGGPKGFRTLRSILAVDKVRAVGDRVAFVVAETLLAARNAAELIEIDYEPLPAVVTVEDAVKPGAPAVWDEAPNNVSFTLMMGNKEATDTAFAGAKHVVIAQGQQHPHQRERDRAARRDRAIPSGQRQLYALFDLAKPAWHALGRGRRSVENPRDETSRHFA